MTVKTFLDFLGAAFTLAIISVVLIRPNTVGVIKELFGGLSGLITAAGAAGSGAANK